MTRPGPDGKRYLVRRDGSLVTEPGKISLDDLEPASARIVQALIVLQKSARRTPAASTGRKRDDKS